MASLAENPGSNKHTRILRLEETMRRTGYSRSKLYRLHEQGVLLRAKNLQGSSSAGWHEDAVDAHNESRRPDAGISTQGAGAGLEKPPKLAVLIQRGHETGDVADADQAILRPASVKSSNSGGVSSDLLATGMVLMGCNVYIHEPTGKLLMDVGKAPALLAGIGVGGDKNQVGDGRRGEAGLGPAMRKRRMTPR